MNRYQWMVLVFLVALCAAMTRCGNDEPALFIQMPPLVVIVERPTPEPARGGYIPQWTPTPKPTSTPGADHEHN